MEVRMFKNRKAARVFETLGKLFCLAILLSHDVLLNSFFYRKELKAMESAMIAWIVADSIVFAIWAVAFFFPSCLGNRMKGWPKAIVCALCEIKYAWVSWAFYMVVVCFKVNHMFYAFAETLEDDGYTLVSPTGLKLSLSLAGVLFLLLVYCHHKEQHGTKYKLIMEKISLTTCLDVLDSLMLVNLLFIEETHIILPFPLDKAIRAFTCICLILPIVPLLSLRIIGDPEKNQKFYKLSVIIHSALYMLLINIPLFSIRLFLWIRHDTDISTFFTKNVIMLFKGCMDIINEFIAWEREVDTDGGEGQQEHNEMHRIEVEANVDAPQEV